MQTTPQPFRGSLPLRIASPMSVLGAYRDLFLSERFTDAFAGVRSMFAEADVTNEQIINLLKGELDFETVDDELFIVDGEDDHFKQDVKEILENYDFLTKSGEQYLQVSRVVDFDLSLIATTNSLIAEFKDHSVQLVSLRENKFAGFISALERNVDSLGFSDHDFACYLNGKFYLFNAFTRPFYVEFCRVYDTPAGACEAYTLAQSAYY